jgi:cytochrome c-type biogenesis protein CcmE
MDHRKLLVGSLLLSAGIVWLVLSQARSTAIYSYGVSAFLERGPTDERVRVAGDLVHGSLCRMADECGMRFSLRDRAAQLPVHLNACVVPDTMRDVPGIDIELVVEGERCLGCHDFEASQVIAKCPGKYEMRTGGSACSMLTPPPPPCTPRM